MPTWSSDELCLYRNWNFFNHFLCPSGEKTHCKHRTKCRFNVFYNMTCFHCSVFVVFFSTWWLVESLGGAATEVFCSERCVRVDCNMIQSTFPSLIGVGWIQGLCICHQQCPEDRTDWQEQAITHHIQRSDIHRNTPWNEKELKLDLESLVFVITDWYLLPFQPRTCRDGDILLYKNVVTPILHAPLWSDFMHFSADKLHFLHIFYVRIILRRRTCMLDLLWVDRKSD